jgi:hypothetical protein
MAKSEIPAVVHPWLGELYRRGEQELRGSINIDPAVRLPRANGSRDAEILLEVGATDFGPSLRGHVEGCATRIKEVLTALPSIRRYAVDCAPQDWADYHTAQPGGPLIDRLFLDGIEVDRQLRVSVVFDFGDLDSLVVQLNDQGHGAGVYVRP